MALKQWIDIAVPKDDVCKGSFQLAEFAADISSVRSSRVKLVKFVEFLL